MANMRRRDTEPPPGPPQIEFKPGMANEMLRELAPLLAEESIDVENIDVPDVETLQRAIERAVKRHNATLFTPVGEARELAVVTLRLVVEALAEDNTTLAGAILEQVQPESPDNSTATVRPATESPSAYWTAGYPETTRARPPALPTALASQRDIGSASGPPRTSSPSPAKVMRFPSATRSWPDKAGQHILCGGALALTAAVQTWSTDTGTPVPELAGAAIR